MPRKRIGRAIRVLNLRRPDHKVFRDNPYPQEVFDFSFSFCAHAQTVVQFPACLSLSDSLFAGPQYNVANINSDGVGVRHCDSMMEARDRSERSIYYFLTLRYSSSPPLR